MNLEARKLTIIEKFIHIENIEIISQVENILAKMKSDNLGENTIKPLTMDVFNTRIKKSMVDSEKDNLISNEDLKSEIQK